jgi:hypothetical protein
LGLLVGSSRPPVIGADLVPAQAHTAFPLVVPGANLGWNDAASYEGQFQIINGWGQT